jgi:hypothetical protein
MKLHSNSLLKRNNLNGHSLTLLPSTASPSLSQSNPFRRPGRELTAEQLVCFMFHLHYRRRLKPQRTLRSYIPQARKFINLCGPEEAEKLMKKAAVTANHPWGFNYLHILRKERKTYEGINSIWSKKL